MYGQDMELIEVLACGPQLKFGMGPRKTDLMPLLCVLGKIS